MWTSNNFKVKINEKFNLKKIVHSLLLEGHELSNAIELISWKEESISNICEHCGVEGCGSGQVQISLRRILNYLVVIPYFLNSEEEIKRPFSWMPALNYGTIYFNDTQSEVLKNLGLSLKKIKNYPEITPIELMYSIQWDVPYNILGDYSSLNFDFFDNIYAISEGNKKYLLNKIKIFIINLSKINSLEFTIIKNYTKITFYFENQENWFDWTPLGKDNSGKLYFLLFENIGINIES